MANDSEITKVRLIIRHFLWQTRDVVRSAEESQKWLRQFRDTLEFQELEENPNAYALAIIAEARSFNDQKKRNGQMKWVRASLEKEGFKNPTEEQLAERWMLMYGQENSPQDAPNGNAGDEVSDAGNGAASKSPTSCDQFTADGDIREDSLDRKSGTSANLYGPRQAKNGDAATREGAEAFTSRESGDAAPTTVSKNMRRVPQNEAPAHGFSGGRTAQGTMSRSPEAAAQSGKDYDKETDKVSTDEKGGCGPLEKPNSQKSPQPSLFPVAKPEKRRYGKYRHVLLSDDEGLKLRESLGEDLEDAVAILDEYIQSLPVKAKGAKKNGAKWWMQEYEAKDHYIVLHHGWARKRLNEMRTEELNARAAELRYSAAETNAKAAEKRLENANSSSQPRQMYLTSDDISRRNAEEGLRQLQLMHQTEGNG